MSEFIANKLKDLSTRQIEELIAEAVSEAIGERIEVDISLIEYVPGITATVKIQVQVSEALGFRVTEKS
jgi:hypothetical protein